MPSLGRITLSNITEKRLHWRMVNLVSINGYVTFGITLVARVSHVSVTDRRADDIAVAHNLACPIRFSNYGF